jgi:hypothetical protein
MQELAQQEAALKRSELEKELLQQELWPQDEQLAQDVMLGPACAAGGGGIGAPAAAAAAAAAAAGGQTPQAEASLDEGTAADALHFDLSQFLVDVPGAGSAPPQPFRGA